MNVRNVETAVKAMDAKESTSNLLNKETHGYSFFGYFFVVPVYCEILNKLRRGIQNKSGVVFVHNNGRLHTARRTNKLVAKLKCDVFDHTPIQPRLIS